MSEYDRQTAGRRYEGWAFTFCKAALLVLIFQRFSLLALSALSVIFYVVAALYGVKQYRCWAKPPWVTLFWAGIFAWQLYAVLHPQHAGHPWSPLPW